MKKFIDLLESELGYKEKADDYTKFGDWYGKNIEFDADYSSAPWCDMYLSWAAAKLGYEDFVGQFAWTVAHAKWFQEQDAWGKTPKVGALVFYDWKGGDDVDGIDHVGIVTRVEGNTIYTIEGNIDGGVAKRKERDTSKVVGYGYPDKIKARLEKEAAQQKAEEETKASTGLPTDADGTPADIGGLTALIPQTAPEEAHPPMAAPAPRNTSKGPVAPKSDAQKPVTQKQTTKPRTESPAPEATPKKGKHAKPATADTSAATTAPLPVVVDAKPAATDTVLGTPALVGSALIAALAVLAVAKTRAIRVRPAAAVPAKPAPKRGRRRRPRRGLLTPALATTRPAEALDLSPTGTDLTTSDLTTSDLIGAELKALANAELIATTGADLATTTGAELAGSHRAGRPLESGAVLDTPRGTVAAQMEAKAAGLDRFGTPLDLTALSSASGEDAVWTKGAGQALNAALRREEGLPAEAPRRPGRRRRHAETPVRHETPVHHETPAWHETPVRHDAAQPSTGGTVHPGTWPEQPVETSHYVFSEDTGALPRFTDPVEPDLEQLTTMALENLDAATARAFAPFDPFTPSRKASAQYHGRRRRQEIPAGLDVTQTAPARGRRHRSSIPTVVIGDILDTPEAFIQDAPLRGRRHRHGEAPVLSGSRHA
ncbi:CHAP domain-containing protein [Nonomuraea typhae]|uniref:CHAP domain-containing protein n=1 Tax=Nonomuraea typhae TaxID=2603600 RepID=UPI0015E1D4F0|nr:CHAP domain-containing protein [Nonomuraea typhae]